MDIGELLVNIRLKTESLEKGLNEVKTQLNKHNQEVKNNTANYQSLAIAATASFATIAVAIKKGTDAFNQYNNAMVGLRSTVQGTGNDFSQAQGFIDKFTNDGLVPAGDAATALKNLLSRGFGMDEASKILERLKDSASFGRQASLSLGEAVKSATEGLKNENSILVDNAGVTKNVAQMWKEYAVQVGKTANDLSIAEKRQAEFNGIMKETQYQVGDAAKYADQFAGAQARNAKATQELSRTFGEALAPSLQLGLGIMTSIVEILAIIIKNNKELLAGVTLTSAVLIGIIAVIASVKGATVLLSGALGALNLSFAGLLANPAVLALTALAGVIGYIAIQNQKAKIAQDQYNKALAEHNRLVQTGITKAQVGSEQEKIDKLKQLQTEYEKATQKYNEYKTAMENTPTNTANTERYGERAQELQLYANAAKKAKEQMAALGATENNVARIIKEKEEAIKSANRTTLEEFNTKARAIAQERTAALETQRLIDVYKKAERGSSEWGEAQKKLADMFPQFSTSSGILIDAIQKVTNAKKDAVKEDWKNLQALITIANKEIEVEIKKRKAIVATLEARKLELEMADVDSAHRNYALGLTDRRISEEQSKLKKYQDELIALDKLATTSIDKITGIKPVGSGSKSSSSSYENKALDDALRLLEHKKHLNQLSLEDEIKTLESIKKKYVKTAEEKMEIEEKIFDAKQSIRDRDKDAQEKALEEQTKLLKKQEDEINRHTEASLREIDRQKLYSSLNGNEEVQQYQALIKHHKEYLNKILADKKISQDEKKRIEQEEIAFIQDQEDKIFSIRKSYIEKTVNEYIDAKRKQYDTEEDLENERLNDKLKALDKEYADRERASKASERATELEILKSQEKLFLNAATKEGQDRLKDIQKDIARLSAEGDRDRLEAEKDVRREAILEEIESNRNKYKTLKEDLDKSQKEMLASASAFANESTKALEDASNMFGESLIGIFTEFDKNNDDMMKRGLEKLRTFVENYKSLMSQISINSSPLALDALGATGTGSKALGQNTTVTVNDYGDKIINSKDEAIDYTQELFATAKNAARTGGMKV